MRYRAAFLGLAVLAAGCGGGKAGNQATAVAPQPPPTAKVTVAIKGATARPKANANWSYSVTARDSTGKKVSGKLTVQIVDPLGNAHAVTYDNTKKPVRNFPFHGTFHDFLQFPKDSIGFPLTVRAKVTSAQGTGTASFGVKPRS